MLLFTSNLSSSPVYTPVLAVVALSDSPGSSGALIASTAMSNYTANTLIQLSGVFTSEPGGVAVDPTTVVCRVEDPTGAIVDISSYLQNPSPGVFTAVYTPTIAGVYLYEFIGTGSIEVANISKFCVNQVPF